VTVDVAAAVALAEGDVTEALVAVEAGVVTEGAEEAGAVDEGALA
jgi:hypothetical protein